MGLCSSSDAAVSQPSDSPPNAPTSATTKEAATPGQAPNDGNGERETSLLAGGASKQHQSGKETTSKNKNNDDFGGEPGVPQDEDGKVCGRIFFYSLCFVRVCAFVPCV
jgi:hypothetical protein